MEQGTFPKYLSSYTGTLRQGKELEKLGLNNNN